MKIKKLYAIVLLQVFKWQFKVEVDHEKKVYKIEFAGDNPSLKIPSLIDSAQDAELMVARHYMNTKFSNYSLLNS